MNTISNIIETIFQSPRIAIAIVVGAVALTLILPMFTLAGITASQAQAIENNANSIQSK